MRVGVPPSGPPQWRASVWGPKPSTRPSCAGSSRKSANPPAADLELDGVELSVKAAEVGAAYRLTQARAELDKARGGSPGHLACFLL